MSKAILITEANQVQILGQFDLDEDALEEMVGLYLVSDFAAEIVDGYLTAENLRINYVTTDKELENGWFEVIKRKEVL